MNKFVCTAAIAAGAVVASSANAEVVGIVGGQTNVTLDFELLSIAAGLDLSGITPGTLLTDEPNTVGFVITPPNAFDAPSTFGYDTGDFGGTFSGGIQHRGGVYFNDDSILVGNFGIGYDPVGGWFVESNLGLEGELFDVDILSATPTADFFDVVGDLKVSAFFAGVLLDAGLAGSDLTGAKVGSASIQGFMSSAVPAPGALAVLGLGGLAARRRRG
ncbi:MAG: hypothetical protein CBC35_03010 [Planctomycetes bacterium TMED75]|nr:hypothetical protein [Planctomycetaceae bacterium]OUU95095.1 MAG: hypothetical protein CBC35_03010 [Planctomycetes bacterium TMED75]